ncbi:hypothetical protein [Paraburkholderia sp. GAS42]|uniref:hypothetical protein n=1 Tax=Paraburkholderia sp. GAS42 TaxID=3035135 RepID=UPI003D1CEC61
MLNAWETQTLFNCICGDYERAWNRRLQQHSFFVQAGWSGGRYARQITRKAHGVTQLLYLPGAQKPGDFSLKRRQTDLTRAASYMFRIHDLVTFDAEQVRDDGLRVTFMRLKPEPEKWARLCAYVEARRAGVLARTKLNHDRTGTPTRFIQRSAVRAWLSMSQTASTVTFSRFLIRTKRKMDTSTCHCLSTANGLTLRRCVPVLRS